MATLGTRSGSDGGGKLAKFIKVKDLTPSSGGHSMQIKVVDVLVQGDLSTANNGQDDADAPAAERPSDAMAADILVGDETGCVLVTISQPEHVQHLQPGWSATLRNFSVVMRKEGGRGNGGRERHSMRLMLDIWGAVLPLSPGLTCKVNTVHDMSLIEFQTPNIIS